MPLIPVHFEYRTGLRHINLRKARLTGSWDGNGQSSEQWSTVPMEAFLADDGCRAFRATAMLDDGEIGRSFRWSVIVDTDAQASVSAIPTEVNDAASTDRHRVFTLARADQTERYYLTHCRRLGANKLFVPGRDAPAVRFAVWAPNAQKVELVRSRLAGENNSEGGYIWNGGRGVSAIVPMRREQDGVWSADLADSPDLVDFRPCDHTLYMFRITKDDGTVAYRTDLYSRCQIGSGGIDPANDAGWDGRRETLDGTKSCSVVVDPERVTAAFSSPEFPETRWLTEEEFWRDEFDPQRPVPTRLEDLVIYELHVDGLGAERSPRGTLQDAIDLLPYLKDLGVNAVELMPLAEYDGWTSWGYGNSHYLAIEYAGGGRDQFKYFIRACHRHGIAVIMDVVYNHYTANAERAQWAYDSNAPERNIYYWYEGLASDYPGANPPGSGGYIDNMSTGWAPRFWEEMVRKLFISSGAMLIDEFHVDGFRVDQTTSLHSYAVIHANGYAADHARVFGAKFLREWTRTMRLVRPTVMLIAEDHSGWPAVTESADAGGLGFDAVWFAEYYHQLIGDATNDSSRARLLKFAGYGNDDALNMTWFAGTLGASATGRVAYHESHDEAGNSSYQENGQEVHSARSIMVAVNNAPLIGETRRYAEARVHFAAGVTLLGPAPPMFFMGEEVGAWQPYRYNDFINFREDYPGLRTGAGAQLFRFYQDLIHLRLARTALRSHALDILHVHDANRVLAFRRWEGTQDILVMASLNNHNFGAGYRIQHPAIADGSWQEIFNSDADVYGGSGLINDRRIDAANGGLTAVLPANSVIVLERVA